MRNRRLTIVLGIIFLAVAIVAFSLQTVSAKKDIVTVRVAHGPTKTGSHMISIAWKKLCEKYSDSVRLSLIPTKSWLTNQNLMAANQADLAWATGFQLAWQVEGIRDFKGKKYDGQRVLWSTLTVPYHMAVLKKSPVKKLGDLAGKRCVTYPPGSVGHNMSKCLQEASGTKFKLLHAGTTDAVAGLKDGTYDAITLAMTLGAPAFEELFTTKPCRLVPLPDNVWQMIDKDFSGWFVKYSIPAGIYKGIDSDVPTFAATAFLLGNASVPEDVIYELCKVWWEHTDEAIAIHKGACGDASRRDYVAYEAIVPRHPGALKYFKEAGILK